MKEERPLDTTKKLKFPCLVVDHDDTVVNSTATIHYPSFAAFMKEFHPEKPIMDLEDYFRLNFDPGVVELFTNILGFSREEMAKEEKFWAAFVKNHIPKAYEGIGKILGDYQRRGGILCVDSHSLSYNILRDYEANGLPKPDVIFGWDLEPELRKPDPYSLKEICRRYGFKPDQLLVLDDLKPGYDMARAAGAVFAAAGWANDIPEIESFMRHNCDYYFKTVEEFGAFLLE